MNLFILHPKCFLLIKQWFRQTWTAVDNVRKSPSKKGANCVSDTRVQNVIFKNHKRCFISLTASAGHFNTPPVLFFNYRTHDFTHVWRWRHPQHREAAGGWLLVFSHRSRTEERQWCGGEKQLCVAFSQQAARRPTGSKKANRQPVLWLKSLASGWQSSPILSVP